MAEQQHHLLAAEQAAEAPAGSGCGGGARQRAARHAAGRRARSSSRPRSPACVAPARGELGDDRPSRITRMRSLMPMISGSSLEIIRMPRPSCASSLIRRWISALAPTSMPRVGSSMIRTLGREASHLPARPSAGCRPRACRRSARGRSRGSRSGGCCPRASARSAPRSMKGPRASSRSTASETFSASRIGRTRPWLPRSSGT